MYVRAETLENFNPVATKVFMFGGRSVFQLRLALAKHLDEEDYSAITLCVRAGSQGRLIPLVTDLPRNKIPMLVVVLSTGSSGEYLQLLHWRLFSILFSTCYFFSHGRSSVGYTDNHDTLPCMLCTSVLLLILVCYANKLSLKLRM